MKTSNAAESTEMEKPFQDCVAARGHILFLFVFCSYELRPLPGSGCTVFTLCVPSLSSLIIITAKLLAPVIKLSHIIPMDIMSHLYLYG